MDRLAVIHTPLGGNKLRFSRMSGSEGLSQAYEYQLELLSDDREIGLHQLLGKNVTVEMDLDNGEQRYFDGYVTRFGLSGMRGRFYLYTATVRPWFWLLTRTQDCRIFQDMTVIEIVRKVFEDHADIAKVEEKLFDNYTKWPYCVQYRETDFNFVSRMLEQEGIYYYFKHENNKHTLVLCDSLSAHDKLAGFEELPFITNVEGRREDSDYIGGWQTNEEVQPTHYVITDYDFERPQVDLLQDRNQSREFTLHHDEVFDYPGEYVVEGDGNQYVRARLDELQSRYRRSNGSTQARGFCCGYQFALTGHPRPSENKDYLICRTSISLQQADYEGTERAGGAGGGSHYTCSFEVLEAATQFRPPRATAKPIVQGPQTAVVVGPAGDEIYTDEYGRVKVLFHWDRLGKKRSEKENSSCWVRVSQPWAGKGWGAVSIPRIGQEVIVDFLEGDPDQPIITGRVYNKEQAVPFALPGSAATSGIKSQTHKGSGFNEMSMDDTAGKEKLNIHAQYDMTTTVLHDQTSTVKNNRSETVNVNDTLTVDANRTMHVKGKLSETVDTGMDLTVSSGYKETITGGATSTITGGQTVDVTGDLTETVSAKESQTVSGGKKLDVTGGFEQTIQGEKKTEVTGPLKQSATATMDLHADGAATYSSNAELTLSVGACSIKITPADITIAGPGSTIKVDASGVSINGAKISLNG
jgi:type VI secretion system secreted protein VgrG